MVVAKPDQYMIACLGIGGAITLRCRISRLQPCATRGRAPSSRRVHHVCRSSMSSGPDQLVDFFEVYRARATIHAATLHASQPPPSDRLLGRAILLSG